MYISFLPILLNFLLPSNHKALYRTVAWVCTNFDSRKIYSTHTLEKINSILIEYRPYLLGKF